MFLVHGDYLSKRNSDCLKGIFAVCVLMHHLYQNSGLLHNSVLGTGLQLLGYVSVGVFFFLSGYGLLYSYQQKGKEYLRAFPRKRLLPFYLMMILLIVIYSVYMLIMGETLTLSAVAQSFLFGATVISKGWYLQMQLLCYICFYFVFSVCRKKTTGLTVLTLLTAVYILVMMLLDYSASWYVSTPLFTAGMWFACCKDGIDAWLQNRRNWLLAFLGAGILFSAAYMGYRSTDLKWLDAALLTLQECAFVLGVLLVIGKVRLDCRLTRMLGAISLEVYVMQGMCLSFFQSRVVNIQNPYLYVAAVSISTVVLAAAIHPVMKAIFSLGGGSREKVR